MRVIKFTCLLFLGDSFSLSHLLGNVKLETQVFNNIQRKEVI